MIVRPDFLRRKYIFAAAAMAASGFMLVSAASFAPSAQPRAREAYSVSLHEPWTSESAPLTEKWRDFDAPKKLPSAWRDLSDPKRWFLEEPAPITPAAPR